MSNPKLKEVNVIILGSWNIAIINPFWLKKEFPKIITEKAPIKANIILGQQAIRFDIKGALINAIIAIDNNAMMIGSELINEKNLLSIAKLTLGIFEKLPHTPIRAVGHNFTYEINNNEDFIIKQFINTKKEFNFYNEFIGSDIIDTQIKHTFYYEDYQLNINYTDKKDSKKINFNFNYPVSSIENIKTSEDVKNFINVFLENYKKSKQLIIKLIKK